MKINELGPVCCEPTTQGHNLFLAAPAGVVAAPPTAQHTFAHATGADVTRPRRLLLCLDGVPLEIMQAAKARGLFAGFNDPSGLLSPFPTMTNIALATMLGASAPLGYECLYFDRNAQELRGGVQKYIGRRTPDKVPSSYMDELDYQEPLPFEYLVYVAPDAVWRADMRRFRERFRRAPRARDYFGFLKGTDGLLHVRGPAKLQTALESFDVLIRELQAYCGRETEIVLFSDHGMGLEESRKIHLVTHLQAQGYEIRSEFRGRGRRELSVPAFGLIGFGAIYCNDETDPAEVAQAVNTLGGVDFSMYRDGPTAIIVRNAGGAARIRRAQHDASVRFAYEQIDGDPLDLVATLRTMKEAGELDAQGFAADDVWLARTAAHTYPDALANLYEAMHGTRVRHTADVLISCQDGYYYGWSLLDRFVRIMATHGNARRGSTTAFLMSTHRTFAPYVRGTEVRPLLRA
jgi:hypothetical protein